MLAMFQFPVWQFLKQPIFEAHYQPILNPKRFSRVYRIDYLERCFEQELESNRRID
jgi:hypothetical protein